MEDKLKRLLIETKEWCDQKRGRQNELARRLGVSRQALHNWLKMKQDPPASVALELQDFMKHRKPVTTA
jgi:transcriptional regulator with XRE-family HTH domain